MDCCSKFPAEVSVSCVVELVQKAREGVSLHLIKDAMWLAGSIMEKFSPEEVPPVVLDSSSNASLDDVLDNLLEAVEPSEPTTMAINWAIVLPLVLKMIEYFLKNR